MVVQCRTMGNEKSLARNYIFNFIKTFCGIAFPLITFIYSSRVLGAEGIGKVNFSKSVVAYFSMISMMGINQYGTREAAKLRDDRRKISTFVQEVVIINLITTVIAFVGLYITIRFLPKLSEYSVLIWINSVTIFMQGLGLEWLYQAEEEYEYITKRSILFQIIAVLALFIFVKDVEDLIKYTIINVFSTSGSYVLNFLYSKKYVDWRKSEEYRFYQHISGMLWLFAMAVSVELYTVLDTTMLGFISGDRAVGLYIAAIRVNKLSISLIIALGVVLVPRLSYYIGHNEKQKMETLVCKGYNYVFLISIPLAVGLFCLSDNIVQLLSGMEYGESAICMRIMAPIVVLIPFSVMTNNQTFVPMGKEKMILVSTCIGAATNFISNFFLIPKYDQNGAALGTVVAESAVACVCIYNAIRVLNMKKVFAGYYQYWVASFPIFVVSYLIKKTLDNSIIQMIVIITCSVTCYILILYRYRNQYFMSIINKLRKKNI